MTRLVAIAFLLLAPSVTWANCLPHDEVPAHLKATHNEILIGKGLSRSGLGVEFFASPEGTWTFVTTDVNGLSCIRAAGTFWQTIEPEPEGQET
jgi:hypothetical protein